MQLGNQREYVIFVSGCDYIDICYSYGKSLGEAKYNLWLRISDCGYWDNFFEFARNCRGRLAERMIRGVKLKCN